MNKASVNLRYYGHTIVGGVTQGIYYIFTVITITPEKMTSKFNWCKKVTQTSLKNVFKPHAYFQSMTKTSVSFQKNWHKNVGGVAYMRRRLSIYFY